MAHSEPLPQPPDVATSPLAGTPYRVVSLLGSGGMGEVYLADHVELGKRFVVKLLHQNMVNDARLVDRMRIEAQALARLKHPSIVQVSDFGRTEAGRPYLVMEWLRGVTLADEIKRRGFLPLAEAIAITRELLGALAVAHSIGIVHRDVKPGNLFLHQLPGHPRTLKVLDFGIAKVVAGAPEHAPRPLLHPTEEGVIVGTPRFISPEAIAGHDVDHRADLYSAALVLYTMLCGRGPWARARRPGQILTAQLRDVPPPPSELASQRVPRELDAIVLKALAKSRDDRHQSAIELDQALACIEIDEPPPAGLATAIFGEPRSPAPSARPVSGSSGNVTLGGAIAVGEVSDVALQTTVPAEFRGAIAASPSPASPAARLATNTSLTTVESGPSSLLTVPTSAPRAQTAAPTSSTVSEPAPHTPHSGIIAVAGHQPTERIDVPNPDLQPTRTSVNVAAPAPSSATSAAAAPIQTSITVRLRARRASSRALILLPITAVAIGLVAWWLLGLFSR